jgi:hypothetical protein
MRHRIKRYFPNRNTRKGVIARGRKRLQDATDKKK